MKKHHPSIHPSILVAFAATSAVAQLPEPFSQGPLPDIKSPWGFCSGAEWSGEYPRFNPLMRAAGVRSARLFPEWQNINPRQGVWDFEGSDKMVADARKNGMEIIGTWCYFAPWTSADGGTRKGPVKDIQFWRDYTRNTAARYRNDIRHWGVWNEFNGSFYSTSGDKARDYAALAAAAYEEVKKIDPRIMTGLNAANFDVGFLNAVIKAGAKGKFDYISVHPYENLGMVMAGEEASYLSLAGSLRVMLASNGEREDIPLWITETGIQSKITADEAADKKQAEAILKVYILSLAQGFERVCWFEARGINYGPGTDHGIIRHDWSLRPAYHALKEMTAVLGDTPEYLGWHKVGNEGFGFLFQGASEPVLVAWASKHGDETAVLAGKEEKFDRYPRFITNLPAALVAEIRANRQKPFPWGRDFSKMETATVRLGGQNIENGVKQVNEHTTRVENALAESWRAGDFNMPGGNMEGRYFYFRADPTFCGFADNRLEITLVAKNAKPGKSSGASLTYESTSGYRGVENGWRGFTDEWAEYAWRVDDASFNGQWGWNFRTDSIGSGNEPAIREVRVRKLAPQP